jgi:hypothetical protein
MDDREALFRLLYLALLEMRVQGHESHNKVVFHLADLFHNLPSRLQEVTEGKATYAEVMAFLRESAKEKHCERWMEQALAGEARRAAS